MKQPFIVFILCGGGGNSLWWRGKFAIVQFNMTLPWSVRLPPRLWQSDYHPDCDSPKTTTPTVIVPLCSYSQYSLLTDNISIMAHHNTKSLNTDFSFTVHSTNVAFRFQVYFRWWWTVCCELHAGVGECMKCWWTLAASMGPWGHGLFGYVTGSRQGGLGFLLDLIATRQDSHTSSSFCRLIYSCLLPSWPTAGVLHTFPITLVIHFSCFCISKCLLIGQSS